jgi:hypothetical protein
VDQRHSNLLSELRYATDEAFGKSERVIAAIMLDANDMLFLRDLKISVGMGAAER